MQVIRTARASAGFTLVEVAIILLIVGLLILSVAKGQQLIGNARVREFIAQQDAVEQAALAFESRYRALPGDYAEASTNIACDPGACLDGNGNGRVEAGTGGAIHEDILAWQHLAAAGFLRGDYRMLHSSVAVPTPDNTPRNGFGGYLQIATDSV